MLPGEAVFTVRSPLVHCQHVGVGWASEHHLPDPEVPHCPKASAYVRAEEPLGPLYAFVLHGFTVDAPPVRQHRPPPVLLSALIQAELLLPLPSSSCPVVPSSPPAGQARP